MKNTLHIKEFYVGLLAVLVPLSAHAQWTIEEQKRRDVWGDPISSHYHIHSPWTNPVDAEDAPVRITVFSEIMKSYGCLLWLERDRGWNGNRTWTKNFHPLAVKENGRLEVPVKVGHRKFLGEGSLSETNHYLFLDFTGKSFGMLGCDDCADAIDFLGRKTSYSWTFTVMAPYLGRNLQRLVYEFDMTGAGELIQEWCKVDRVDP